MHGLLWFFVAALLPSFAFGWKLGKASGRTDTLATSDGTRAILKKFSLPFMLLLVWAAIVFCWAWEMPRDLWASSASLACGLAIVTMLAGLGLQWLDQREEEEKFLHGID